MLPSNKKKKNPHTQKKKPPPIHNVDESQKHSAKLKELVSKGRRLSDPTYQHTRFRKWQNCRKENKTRGCQVLGMGGGIKEKGDKGTFCDDGNIQHPVNDNDCPTVYVC